MSILERVQQRNVFSAAVMSLAAPVNHEIRHVDRSETDVLRVRVEVLPCFAKGHDADSLFQHFAL